MWLTKNKYMCLCVYTHKIITQYLTSRIAITILQLTSILWVVSDSLRPHGLQHARLPCPSPSPGVCSDSCPLSLWCHFILCHLFLPSIFPSIRVFSNESVLHISGQSVGASALASALPMNIQGWFPLGWIRWISLQSKEISRAFSNTAVQRHQFFGPQPYLWSSSHICTWLLVKP